MSCILNKLPIFEVRNTSNHGANTETKTKGRRTVESTAVISMHRIEVLRSDLPPLFNQNHFIMRNTNDGANCPTEKAISAEEILKSLLSVSKIGAEDLRNDLRQMIDACLIHEEETETREALYESFREIDVMLSILEEVENQPKLKLVS